MTSRVIATGVVSVRLSVCLSVFLCVTIRYCVKTTEHRIIQFLPPGGTNP